MRGAHCTLWTGVHAGAGGAGGARRVLGASLRGAPAVLLLLPRPHAHTTPHPRDHTVGDSGGLPRGCRRSVRYQVRHVRYHAVQIHERLRGTEGARVTLPLISVYTPRVECADCAHVFGGRAAVPTLLTWRPRQAGVRLRVLCAKNNIQSLILFMG
jgi:hypothetical protein